MSKLLINEPPRMVPPTLAVKLAKVSKYNNDRLAMLLQQIHFWLHTYEQEQRDNRLKGGRWWVKKSAREWHREFPFWSERTIKNLLKELAGAGLLEVDALSENQHDRTNWYTINYDALSALAADSETLSQGGGETPSPPSETLSPGRGGKGFPMIYTSENKDIDLSERERDRQPPKKDEPPTPVLNLPDLWDRNNREALPDKDRADLMQFQEWYFTYAGEQYQLANNRKRNCALYALRFWTAKEIKAALKTACGKADRSPWGYFVACLEQMARGEWNWSGKGRSKAKKSTASEGLALFESLGEGGSK